MNLDLNRALRSGMRLFRAARAVKRTLDSSRGGLPGGADHERTARYPGDFTGRARVEYAPVPGPEAGPGEVVWTWVPFEELDGRGKDRPVLIVARDGQYLLGLMLTSKDRNNDHACHPDFVDVGSGAWDSKGRESEAKLDRIVRVDPADVRRDGGVLPRSRFRAVAEALGDRRGWTR